MLLWGYSVKSLADVTRYYVMLRRSRSVLKMSVLKMAESF